MVDRDCRVFSAPFDVLLLVIGKELSESGWVVQPDKCVICDPTQVKEQGCFRAPEWTIEILSPHTAKKDLQDKYALPEEFGVQKYWIVEPKNSTIKVFVLRERKYERIGAYVRDDLVASHIISQWSD